MANPIALDDSYPANVNQTLRVGQGEFVGRAAASRLRTKAAPGTLSSASVAFSGTGTLTRLPLRASSLTLYLGVVTPTNITTLTFSPTISGTGLPVTFAQAFKAGDVPAGASVEVLGRTTQFDIKATHPDGSVRHAIITALIDVTAGVSQLVQLRTRSPVGGVAITKANVLSSAFDASVSADIGGTMYSATARDLLQNTTPKDWLSGPLVAEFIVTGPLKTAGGTPHAHLAAYFHVRAYGTAGNVTRVRCDVVVENGWTFTAGSNLITYAATAVVGGTTIYSNPTYSHYHHSRWHQVGWWGEDPQVYAKHNGAYLRTTKVVPNYAAITPTEGVLSSYTQTVVPGSNADLRTYWPDGGYHKQLGLLPEWDVALIMSGDRRAFNAVLANASAGGANSYHYRDENTGYPPKITTYPTLSDVFNSGGLVQGAGGKAYTHDTAHQPSIGYLAYLLTGDYFYLEELQFIACWNPLARDGVLPIPNWWARGAELGIFVNEEIRASAWSIRTAATAAAITPDSHALKTYLTGIVNNNMTYYAASIVPTNVMGAIKQYDWAYQGTTFNQQVWQNDFFVATMGWVYDLGFTDANTTAVRNWMAKFPVGRLGQNASGFCKYYATQYSFPSGVVNADNATYNASFAQLYAENFGLSCVAPGPNGGLMQLEAYIGTTSYYANMQPAVAAALDAGVATPETWYTFNVLGGNVDYTAAPTWAIVPRSNTALNTYLYSVAAAMTSGQWATLDISTAGLNAGPAPYILDGKSNSLMIDWANSGVWDPATLRVHFAGAPAGSLSLPSATTHVKYDALTNSWTGARDPMTGVSTGHTYDNNAIDVAGRRYFKARYNGDIHIYDLSTGVWTGAVITRPATNVGLYALAVHPKMGSQGSLILYSGDAHRLYRYDFVTAAWTLLVSGATTELHGICEYQANGDSGNGIIVCGSGSTLYKITSAGTVTTYAAPPIYIALPVENVNSGIFIAEPNSANIFVLYGTGSSYRFNVDTGTWTGPTALPAPYNDTQGGAGAAWASIGIPIDTYGVIMYVKFGGGGTSSVRLYKP